MEEQPQVEILVHIGAPSRAADDALYRSLASSYINFEPASRVDPFDKAQSHDVAISSSPSNPFGSFKSPQASFRSVIDNADSPCLVARRTPEAESAQSAGETSEQVTRSPWHTPSSVVQDSYFGNAADISVLLTSPTRVLESYLQHFDSPSTPRIASQETGSGTSHQTSQILSRPRTIKDKLVASSVPVTPQTVPCTPRYNPDSNTGEISARESKGERQGRNIADRPKIAQQDEVSSDNIIEETIIMDSSDPSSATRADSEPPPAKRARLNAAGTSPRSLLRAASDIGPRSASNQRSPLTVTFLSDHGYTFDSIEILAPEPPVSVADLDSQSFITPGLERLARDLDIPKRYQPSKKTRDLRPFERGYWYLDCSAWDPQLKRDTWAYLANYVGTGVAGWGIRCTRDTDFQRLRVYCWGSVTAHVYLLLYLATQRRIRYTGSSWIDGEGIPVIIMEGRH
ncbi:hypothetical protein GGR52DRAFT_353506 [Hypoxylon sp. FL1284]|nr:hypothetical protein GGR52DRAFT_353506 [Hypoxylon sp. FL1284]